MATHSRIWPGEFHGLYGLAKSWTRLSDFHFHCVPLALPRALEVAAGAQKVSILLAFEGGSQQAQYENLHCRYNKFAILQIYSSLKT